MELFLVREAGLLRHLTSVTRASCDPKRNSSPDSGEYLLFLRCFFFWLALDQRDLLDARRIGRAPRRDIGIVLESIVDETPFVGIHRLELKRATGNAHTFGQFPNPLHDAVFAHRAVMLAIHYYLFNILIPVLQQSVKQKLHGD